MGYWISYGGGVNSTALAVLIVAGALPQYQEARFIFADTLDEKPETYEYLNYFKCWLQSHGRELITVRPEESVLSRWQKYQVTGSRRLRACTDHAKIRPITEFIRGLDKAPVQLIGIDAGEPHRARPANPKKKEITKCYPLVDLGIDRDECARIIELAGLQVPAKSGCWHCPFMRVGEVISLAQYEPEKFSLILALEANTREREDGRKFYQWRDLPATYWLARSKQGLLNLEWDDLDPAIPCLCLD